MKSQRKVETMALGISPTVATKDMTGMPCPHCKKGTLAERQFHDDMDGVLRCDKCKAVVPRYLKR